MSYLAAALVLLAPSHAYGASVRTEVNFNYGWRFFYTEKNESAGPGTCAFPKSLDGLDCSGLERNPNRFVAGDCARACCYLEDCLFWQHSGRECLHGYAGNLANITCTEPKKPSKYTGGQRDAKPNPPFLTNRTRGNADFDDSDWERVTLPHDFVARNGTITETASDRHGYFTRGVGWYRKRFSIPDEFKGDGIFLRFEGAFHVADIYVNGRFIQTHSTGYLGFTVRLDNLTTADGSTAALRFGGKGDNVVAIRCDASFGSGHWFEGGGLWRGVELVRVSSGAHITEGGFFVDPQVDTSKSAAEIPMQVEVETFGAAALGAGVWASFALYEEPTGTPVGVCENQTQFDASIVTIFCTLKSTSALRPWATAKPFLYRAEVNVGLGSAGTRSANSPGDASDAMNTTCGFRTAGFDSQKGFSLNGNGFSMRGFSHHHTFAGLGASMEGVERMHLFKAQASRALGANTWRMSHNPYAPALYSILDRVGTVVWDENRDYGAPYIAAMGDMVKRDRGHPSVVMWSTCNEYECIQIYPNATAKGYYDTAKSLNPTRPVAANNNGKSADVGQAGFLDVQGRSHASLDPMEQFHESHPDVPIVLSECCSCQTQRMVMPNVTKFDIVTDRTVATCEATENSPGLAPYNLGSLGVWTLFDYFGEPVGWPTVSSSFGQFDLAGFPKPHAYWYRMAWAKMHSGDDSGAPLINAKDFTRILGLLDNLPGGKHPVGSEASCEFPTNLTGLQCKGLAKVTGIESAEDCAQACCDKGPTCGMWQFDAEKQDSKGCWVGTVPENTCEPHPDAQVWLSGSREAPPNCTLEVVSTSPRVEVIEDGKSLGVQDNNIADEGNATGATTWSISCTAGIVKPGVVVTARGLSASGVVQSEDKIVAPESSPSAVNLIVDSPSKSTGTGSSLVLDGRDVALIRAELVDSKSNLITAGNSNYEVTFSVASGPARVVGTGNGDASSHVQPSSSTIPFFGGVARGLVQVNADCLSSNRDLIAAIDADTTVDVLPPGASPPEKNIEVKVRVNPGGFEASVQIPVSCNEWDTAVRVAETSGAEELDYTYIAEFRG